MALWKSSDFKDFCFAQIFPLLIHFLIIAIFACNSYNVKYFFYVTPVILLLMYHLFQCFWQTSGSCTSGFKIIFTGAAIILSGMFFGIFVGIFGSTLKFPLESVDNCYVSGQLVVNVLGIEKYSILYVNYEKDGETYLGYGCTSGQSQTTSGIYPLLPYMFYSHGDTYPCGKTNPDASYYSNENRVLENKNKQVRMTAFDDTKNKRTYDYGCLEKWTFSQVKLPSWMCLPTEFPYDGLVSPQKCFITHLGDKQTAIQNSKNRTNLKYTSHFMIVGFTDLLVPLDQHILFLVFCYCPFIVTLNFFSVPLTVKMKRFFNEAMIKYNKFHHIPYGQRNLNKQQSYNLMLNQISPNCVNEQKELIMQESEQQIFKLVNENQVDNLPQLNTPEIIPQRTPPAQNNNEINLEKVQIKRKQKPESLVENMEIEEFKENIEEAKDEIEQSGSASDKSFKG